MTELDLELKLRCEKAFWSAGYYTRSNVKLASLGTGRTGAAVDLTDVDLLAVRFLEDLSSRKIAVDCKAGKRTSPIARTFWLRGVMDHFGAERGYVVMARDIPDHQREAAANLSITILGEPELEALEQRFPALDGKSRIGSVEAHKYLEGNLGVLDKQLGELVSFRNTNYWYLDTPRALMQAISVTRRSMAKIDLKQKFHKALVLDTTVLFGLSLLTLAGDLIRYAPHDLLEAIRAFFFGGPEGILQREQIIRQIRGLVERMTGQGSLKIDENVFQLDPPYLRTLAEVLIRLMARPVEAAEAPRYLRVKLVHGVLYDEWDTRGLWGSAYSAVSDKLAGDVALAFLSSAGFDLAAAKDLGVE